MQVYLITNKVNGKRYVGQTVFTLEQRWKQHVGDSHTGSTTNFHNAIRKYGPENFLLRTLLWCKSKREMNAKEKHSIVSMKTLRPDGYNLTAGGDGSFGYKHTEKSLRKMRRIQRANPTLGMLGKKHSEETKIKISKARIGKKMPPRSAATRAKISKAHLGKKRPPFSKEWLLNMSKSHKGLCTKKRCKRGHARIAGNLTSSGSCKKCAKFCARERYRRIYGAR